MIKAAIRRLPLDRGSFILLAAPTAGDISVTSNDSNFGKDDCSHFWLIDQFKAMLGRKRINEVDDAVIESMRLLTTKNANLLDKDVAYKLTAWQSLRRRITDKRKQAANLAARQALLTHELDQLVRAEAISFTHHIHTLGKQAAAARARTKTPS